jgi:CO/xanthine dehydrogenase Mo-binding subunit
VSRPTVIMNATYDALGVRIRALPAVPEKMLMVIRR